jgi:hypothetical protein
MRRVRAVAVAATMAVVGLAGCGGDGGAQEPAAESPAQESSSTSTTGPTTAAETRDPAADCLVGEWSLDTADYQAQAFSYMGGLGIPIDSLTIGGEQVVEFQDRGVMTVRTDLHIDAVVFGHPVSTTSQSSGSGEWSTDAGGLAVENWIWGIEPAVTSPDQPSVPLFDPTGGPSTAECVGDTLRLQGPGAPLAGNFVRM